jgi:hypothetical protein
MIMMRRRRRRGRRMRRMMMMMMTDDDVGDRNTGIIPDDKVVVHAGFGFQTRHMELIIAAKTHLGTMSVATIRECRIKGDDGATDSHSVAGTW